MNKLNFNFMSFDFLRLGCESRSVKSVKPVGQGMRNLNLSNSHFFSKTRIFSFHFSFKTLDPNFSSLKVIVILLFYITVSVNLVLSGIYPIDIC